jgi:hypothetical protein
MAQLVCIRRACSLCCARLHVWPLGLSRPLRLLTGVRAAAPRNLAVALPFAIWKQQFWELQARKQQQQQQQTGTGLAFDGKYVVASMQRSCLVILFELSSLFAFSCCHSSRLMKSIRMRHFDQSF